MTNREIIELRKGQAQIDFQCKDSDQFYLLFGFLSFIGCNVKKGPYSYCVTLYNFDFDEDDTMHDWNNVANWIDTHGITCR